MSVTECKCPKPHVRKVKTSALSIFGEGVAWLAARPGHMYLAGHGFHFDTWQEAANYANGKDGVRP